MRQIRVAAVAAGLVLALAACGGERQRQWGSAPPSDAPVNAGGGGSGPCSVVSATGEVAGTIAGNAFAPSPVALTAGQTVTFTNEDRRQPHGHARRRQLRHRPDHRRCECRADVLGGRQRIRSTAPSTRA